MAAHVLGGRSSKKGLSSICIMQNLDSVYILKHVIAVKVRFPSSCYSHKIICKNTKIRVDTNKQSRLTSLECIKFLLSPGHFQTTLHLHKA